MTIQKELVKIARLIDARRKAEEQAHTFNRPIGGGQIVYNGLSKKVWIVNYEQRGNYRIIRDITGEFRDTASNGTIHTLQEYGKGSVVITKNHPIGSALLRQFGTNVNVGNLTYDFLSNYIWGTDFFGPLKIGSVQLGKYITTRLRDLLDAYKKAKEETKRQNSINNTPNVFPSIEELKEEEISEIPQETLKLLQEELLHQEEVSQEAYRFIREQAELRNNPILDEEQEKAKFAHAFDNVTEVIDGGPGTGKTTTLIQRLKYLISPKDINAQRVYNCLPELTPTQFEIINQERKNWIFFSPTPLLCKYLRSNMIYEGLLSDDSNTVVWAEHLRNILRDEYQLFGKDNPFDVKKSLLAHTRIFKGKNLKLATTFESFLLKTLISRIAKVATLDSSIFKWKFAAGLIVKTCDEIKDSQNFTDLIRGIMKLQSIRKEEFGKGTMSVQQVVEEYTALLKHISLSIFHRLQSDEDTYNKLLKIVASWEINEEENSDIEESEEAMVDYATQSRENRLNSFIRNIVRKLSVMKIDSKESLTPRQSQIYNLIQDLFSEGDLEKLSTYAYFYQNFIPVKNIENFLFGQISSSYKRFRAEALKTESEDWDLSTLETIVKDNKNRPLHQQEQALLMGAINNLILIFRKIYPSRFSDLKHKYVQAYRNVIRPIIGVDEATDYSLYDYYAISSLKHPDINCITLSGDIMQCLNEQGITDWKSLKSPYLFTKIDICELAVSYRQSPKLLNLAKHLYKTTIGKLAPYRGLMEDCTDVPKPLWFESDNSERKAQWIVDRIIEVKRAYKKVPSIAVFVSSPEQIQKLREDMYEELENEGLEVIDCSNGLIEARKDTIRLFPIDMVKGMEFEVVFFHDIQNITNTLLIDKYLYIGLSRASFYMGVTSNKQVDSDTESVKKLFTLGENWSNI